MLTENTKLQEGYSRVFVMPGMIAGGKANAELVEKFILDNLGVRIQYLEEVSIAVDGVTAEEVTQSIEAAAETIAAKMRGDESANDLPYPDIKGRSDFIFALNDEDDYKLRLLVLLGQVDVFPLDIVWDKAKDYYPERLAEYFMKK